MRISPIVWTAIALVFSFLPSVHAAAEAENDVLLKVEMFHLQPQDADALLRAEPVDADLYQSVQRAVQAGSAVADKLMLARASYRHAATVKQVDEFMRPENPKDKEERNFVVQPLGEVLTITPNQTDKANQVSLTVEFTSTQANLSESSPATFPTRNASATLTGISGQPLLIGRLQSEPGKTGKETSISLAFVTPTFDPVGQKAVAPKLLPSSVRAAQWEVISLPQALAATLLTGNAEEIYGKLPELLNAKTAKLEILQMLRLKPSQRCIVHHLDEFPYPNDFDGPQQPETVIITEAKLREQLMKPRIGKPPLPAPNAGSNLIIPLSPRSIEVRNLGDMLELETTADEGSSSNLSARLTAEKVRLLNMRQVEGKDEPVFSLQSLATTVKLKLNEPSLVGTLNAPSKTGAPGSNNDERVWLAFLTLRE